MIQEALCINCEQRIVPDDLGRGWVHAPPGTTALFPGDKMPLFFLCSFCRPQTKIEWHKNGTVKAVVGPSYRRRDG